MTQALSLESILEMMDETAYQNLCYAVETGRWQNGTKLTPEQRDICMQAVMIYQSKHNHDAEHMTIAAGGEMHLKSKAELKKVFSEQEDIFRTKVDHD